MVPDALTTKSFPDPVLTQHRDVMMGHTPYRARLFHYFCLFLILTNGTTTGQYEGE
jgi:hypothetical protein